MRNPDDADDLVQDAFLRAFERSGHSMLPAPLSLGSPVCWSIGAGICTGNRTYDEPSRMSPRPFLAGPDRIGRRRTRSWGSPSTRHWMRSRSASA
jgi:hypothetical protein